MGGGGIQATPKEGAHPVLQQVKVFKGCVSFNQIMLFCIGPQVVSVWVPPDEGRGQSPTRTCHKKPGRQSECSPLACHHSLKRVAYRACLEKQI